MDLEIQVVKLTKKLIKDVVDAIAAAQPPIGGKKVVVDGVNRLQPKRKVSKKGKH